MVTIRQFYRNYAVRQGVRLTAALAVWLAAAGTAPAFQAVHPVSGRKIAQVMGAGGADWLERNERESEEHPDAALDALQLKPGMVVADVGAGTGYMTLRMARRVGPSGKVYGEDLQPEMLRLLRQNAAKVLLVDDDAIVRTQQLLWETLRVVAEPGGCAALAALVSGRYEPAPGETVAVVISGANTTAVDFGRQPGRPAG